MAPPGNDDLPARRGIRMTSQRQVIWQVLAECTRAVDAVELLQCTRARMPQISLGTIYRFLRELERHALVRAHTSSRHRTRWCVIEAPPVQDDPRVAALHQLADAMGYRVVAREPA